MRTTHWWSTCSLESRLFMTSGRPQWLFWPNSKFESNLQSGSEGGVLMTDDWRQSTDFINTLNYEYVHNKKCAKSVWSFQVWMEVFNSRYFRDKYFFDRVMIRKCRHHEDQSGLFKKKSSSKLAEREREAARSASERGKNLAQNFQPSRASMRTQQLLAILMSKDKWHFPSLALLYWLK